MTRTDRQSLQTPDNQAHKNRSVAFSFGRFLAERLEHANLVAKRQNLHLKGEKAIAKLFKNYPPGVGKPN